MQFTQTIQKGKTKYSGPRAECFIVLSEKDNIQECVKIATSKGGFKKDGQRVEGITTIAYAVTRKQENGYVSESTLIFGNGQVTLHAVECKRVTDKAVADCHAAALQLFSPSEIVEHVKGRIAA